MINITGLDGSNVINVYSIDGKILYSQDVQDTAITLSLSGISPGLIVIEIINDEGIAILTEKIVKM